MARAIQEGRAARAEVNVRHSEGGSVRRRVAKDSCTWLGPAMATKGLRTHLDLGEGGSTRTQIAASLSRLRVQIVNLEQVVREIAPGCDPNEIQHDVEHLLPAVIALRVRPCAASCSGPTA